MPDPASALPGLPALLPLHRRHDDARNLDGAGPRQGARARRPLRHARHEDHRLVLGGSAGLRPLRGEAAPVAGLPRLAEDPLGGHGYFAVVGDSRTKAQIGTAEWISDYPAASGFFNALLTCASFLPNSPYNLNAAEFCDPRIDRQIKQALAEQATNPDAARGLWERIDRQTVDQAPWVPLVNPKVVDVLSKRVGNYQYSPARLGMLIDQLWVQ